jgi:hypothetical protein
MREGGTPSLLALAVRRGLALRRLGAPPLHDNLRRSRRRPRPGETGNQAEDSVDRVGEPERFAKRGGKPGLLGELGDWWGVAAGVEWPE